MLSDEAGPAVTVFVEEMERAGADVDPDVLAQDCVAACVLLARELRARR